MDSTTDTLAAFSTSVWILIISAVLIVYTIKNRKYKQTEYYQQTHTPYMRLIYNKASLGEYYIYKYLRPLKGHKKYLFNCYVPKDDGATTEIDVIMLHESGIYVFESKNYSGWIFGSENQQTWAQTLPSGRGRSHKSHFLNPIIQNQVHLKWLQGYIGEESTLPFYSYTVFSDRCTLKDITLTSGNHNVINRYDILPAIRKNSELTGKLLSEKEINELYNTLYPLTQADGAVKFAHIDSIKQRLFSHCPAQAMTKALPISEDKTCPRCGGKMVCRTASKGERAGKKFWGCANFPNCRYIENIDE